MVLKVEGGVWDCQGLAGASSFAPVGVLRDAEPGEWIRGWRTTTLQHGNREGYVSDSEHGESEGGESRGNSKVAWVLGVAGVIEVVKGPAQCYFRPSGMFLIC